MKGNSHEREAHKWLQLLRVGAIRYDQFLRYLLTELDKGNLSFADIGTSDAELEELWIKHCAMSAQRWLSYMRREIGRFDLILANMRTELRKGNLSPEDIGTNESEIEELRVKFVANQPLLATQSV